mmetsp:Transcript_4901/g.10835  ORF Transcript_4901/g.10835 Transcript_4901/m.10835 type:complete len:205 (+) Transcript_4901:613-1227(+)
MSGQSKEALKGATAEVQLVRRPSGVSSPRVYTPAAGQLSKALLERSRLLTPGSLFHSAGKALKRFPAKFTSKREPVKLPLAPVSLLPCSSKMAKDEALDRSGSSPSRRLFCRLSRVRSSYSEMASGMLPDRLQPPTLSDARLLDCSRSSILPPSSGWSKMPTSTRFVKVPMQVGRLPWRKCDGTWKFCKRGLLQTLISSSTVPL